MILTPYTTFEHNSASVPLLPAVQNDFGNIVLLLINYGANPLHKHNAGYNAFDVADDKQNYHITKLLQVFTTQDIKYIDGTCPANDLIHHIEISGKAEVVYYE